VRVAFRDQVDDPKKLAEGLWICAQIQEELWGHARAAAQESPGPVVVSFIDTLNALIDTDAERLAAHHNKIPATIWLLVVFVAASGCFTSAYRSGTQGARSDFTSFLLPLLLTIVIGLIYDMDHSLQGVISVSQKPLLDLQESISK
jgi:hypothetical protein